jgi:glycosyltransferase involved in cell wall biosynthesis
MRKKVLYMVTKGNFGGAQKYVFDLATNLDKNNYESVVACGEGELLKEKLKNEGVRVIEIPGLVRDVGLLREILSLFNFLKIIKEERPDIIHVNSSKAGGLGALAGRVMRIRKIIYTIHGWPFKEPRDIFVRAIIWLMSYVSALLATQNITISKEDYDLTRFMLFVKRKTIHIHNGISKINFLERDSARKILAPDLNEGLWIGVIAELHRNKNLDFLIEGFAQIKNKENLLCVIIGEGEEKKKLGDLVNRLGLDEKVRFVGFVKDAPRYLGAFDIFVLPSVKEGLPYTILEAGQRGLPVIGSDISGIREIVEYGKTGLLFKLGYLNALKGSLETLIENENLRRDLGANLREKVIKNFSLQTMIEKTTRLY